MSITGCQTVRDWCSQSIKISYFLASIHVVLQFPTTVPTSKTPIIHHLSRPEPPVVSVSVHYLRTFANLGWILTTLT